MTLTKRLTPLVLALTLLITPVSTLAKTGKPTKVIKSSVTAASVKPQGSCDQSCYQEFFNAIATCNEIHYLDPSEGLYTECVNLARTDLALCQFFCRFPGILGKAQSKSAHRGSVRLSE